MIRLLRAVFVHDFWLKVTALACAVLVWFYVDQKLSEEMTFTVPVSRENIRVPDDRMILDLPVREVQVTVHGQRGILQNMAGKPIDLHLQLPHDVLDGIVSIPLTDESFRLPQDVTVAKISPAAVTVRVAKRHIKLLRVRPKVTGTPAAGYRVADVTARPNVVTVSGPRAILEFEEILTEALDIGGTSASVNGIMRIRARVERKESGETLDVVCEESVTVTVTVVPEAAPHRLSAVPVGVLSDPGSPFAVTLEPARVDVKVKGPLEAVKKLPVGKVVALADVTGLIAGTHSVPVSIMLPEGIALDGPGIRVQATLIAPPKIVARVLPEVPVRAHPAHPPAHPPVFTPAAVRVILRGPEAAVATVEVDHVLALVNLAGASVGEQERGVLILAPAGVTAVAAPAKVRVTIRPPPAPPTKPPAPPMKPPAPPSDAPNLPAKPPASEGIEPAPPSVSDTPAPPKRQAPNPGTK